MSPRAPGAVPALPRLPRWYTLAWVCALPLVAAYLLWRSLRQPEYRRHWAERFLGRGGAFGDGGPGRCVIWVHAVSLGETRAVQPLLQELARARPQARFILTHMTPTGRAAGAQLAAGLPGRVLQRYLPYDLPWAVRRFLRETRPQLGVLMETEIWPTLLCEARAAALPMLLANARLSERSLAKALRVPTLMGPAAACLSSVGAQTVADRARLARVYRGPIRVTGNIKFDLVPDAQLLAAGRQLRDRLRAHYGERPVWLFASTREGEEALIVAALRLWHGAQGGTRAAAPLLLMVPRHPQRFDEVAHLLQEAGHTVLRRARWEATLAAPGLPGAALPVLLGDSIGEMPLYYAMADIALIGGSLLPLGGQNLIEACACGCPVLVGPHMFNFAQAALDAREAGAARAVATAHEAFQAMASISTDAAVRAGMAQAALAFCALHRGASARTLALVDQLLPA